MANYSVAELQTAGIVKGRAWSAWTAVFLGQSVLMGVCLGFTDRLLEPCDHRRMLPHRFGVGRGYRWQVDVVGVKAPDLRRIYRVGDGKGAVLASICTRKIELLRTSLNLLYRIRAQTGTA